MIKDGFYGMEKISLLDYEGYVVCTLFTSGCNFRCPWCHNAPLALSMVDEPMNFDEILDYLSKRKGIIDGVCITGGEPTMMPSLITYIKQIKALGLLVKLDTNGTNPQVVKTLIDEHLVDYIAMDIKSSMENYPKITNTAVIQYDRIMTTIKLLEESNIPHEFRTTLIEEFHTENDIIEIGKIVKGTKIFYLQKYVERDSCISHGFHEIKKEKALEFKSLLEKYINKVELRGY